MKQSRHLTHPLGLIATLGLLTFPACDSPAITRTLPPGVAPVRQTPEGEEAEALGERPAESINQPPPPQINLSIAPAPPTEPGEVAEMVNGLKYVTLKPGEGPQIKAGQKATVHYVGTLADGSVFDSSRQRNEPFTFTIGASKVIEGWERGIAGMQVGEVRKLTVPADLAYKDQGKGSIPPNSTLIFEIELVKIGD